MNFHFSRVRHRRGFTLIELLTVMALVQLAAIVIFNMTAVKNAGSANGGKGPRAKSDPTLGQDIQAEGNAIADPNDPDSLQSVTMRLVVTTTSADPASSLDQTEIDALDRSLTDHQARLQRLIARIDVVLAGNLSPSDVEAWKSMRVSVAGVLDGVTKMKQVIDPHASSSVSGP